MIFFYFFLWFIKAVTSVSLKSKKRGINSYSLSHGLLGNLDPSRQDIELNDWIFVNESSIDIVTEH